MIKSMTGFGRGESNDGIYNFSVEIKTLNHRYNDIVLKIPKHINYLEEKIKKIIKDKISRGRVEVYVNLDYIIEPEVDIKVDISLAKSYMNVLMVLKEELGIDEEITLNHIINNNDIINVERKELDEEKTWRCLKDALVEALDNTIQMRIEEGEQLAKDISSNLLDVERKVKLIEERSPLVVEEYRDKLSKRVKELLSGEYDYDIDSEKLANDVVFFAEKSNINEEVIRLYSHINQFLESLEENEPVGRKLDFLIQEMNREINTIGSKASDLEIAKNVVEVKSELEKVREQIQNIE